MSLHESSRCELVPRLDADGLILLGVPGDGAGLDDPETFGDCNGTGEHYLVPLDDELVFAWRCQKGVCSFEILCPKRLGVYCALSNLTGIRQHLLARVCAS